MEIDVRSRPRVVVSEDNQSTLLFICELLRSTVDVVEAVHDGRGAIDAVHRTQPDVLVLEVLLPVLDGIQVVRRLHASNTGCKVVVLTGLENREFIDAAILAGADGFVFKRRMAVDLSRAIEEVMAGRTFVSSDPPRE